MDKLEKEKAKQEYYQLRNDDKDFAEQWEDNEKDFNEWLKDVWLSKELQ